MQWLQDPSGMLERLTSIVATQAEAASFLRYLADRGNLLTDGTTCLLLGTEVAALFSFVIEERAGRDLLEHYRWHGATPGEHGPAIQELATRLPVDHAWTERLRAVGLAVVDRREVVRYVESTWSIALSTEDI
jgi:hypothetical protein